MADFQTSTQRARWIFTPQDLLEKHEAANQRAIKMLEQEFCQARDGEQEKFKDLWEAAKAEVGRIMLTDVPLLFPSGQLALAALHRLNVLLRVVDFERYLEHIFSRQCSAHTISELAESLMAVDFLVGKLNIPTAEDLRHIDRKLKSCWDPSSQDENKKREKRSNHKSKKTASEMQGGPDEV